MAPSAKLAPLLKIYFFPIMLMYLRFFTACCAHEPITLLTN